MSIDQFTCDAKTAVRSRSFVAHALHLRTYLTSPQSMPTSRATLKQRIEFAFTGVMALCAVLVTAQVLNARGASSTIRHIDNWRAFAAKGIRVGPADAVVTITEFTDFQCPFCRRLSGSLDTV